MSVLSDEARAELLRNATELLDAEQTHERVLREGLELCDVPQEVVAAAVILCEAARELAFQRGRAICMLESVDAMEQGIARHERGEGG